MGMQKMGQGFDIEVGKIRGLNDSTNIGKWKYHASSPKRNFENGLDFKYRAYKNLKDMAYDINQVTGIDEDFRIVSKNKELLIKSEREGLVHRAYQCSELDNDELAELAQHLFIFKQKKLEEVATH